MRYAGVRTPSAAAAKPGSNESSGRHVFQEAPESVGQHTAPERTRWPHLIAQRRASISTPGTASASTAGAASTAARTQAEARLT